MSLLNLTVVFPIPLSEIASDLENARNPQLILDLFSKFNRPTEVLKLLSLKESLPKSVKFKPDLSKQQHTTESKKGGN